MLRKTDILCAPISSGDKQKCKDLRWCATALHKLDTISLMKNVARFLLLQCVHRSFCIGQPTVPFTFRELNVERILFKMRLPELRGPH